MQCEGIITFVCLIFELVPFVVFSSPEHEVLMVSYCDRAVSGVRRPSCVVRRQLFTLCTL